MSNKELKLPLTGRCQCGNVVYEILEMPLTVYACHCTECQKQSSSGYGMSMPVPKTGFKVTGELSYWCRNSEDGNTVTCAFCPNCGTRIFHLPLRNEEIVNVKPGTLDNTKWLEPVGHLWTSSAQNGTWLPDTALLYTHQPESFEPLIQRWQAKHNNDNA